MKTPYLPPWAGLCALVLCGRVAALSTGDIAFTGFRSDGPDELAFVALVAIPGNETIHLTNNSWNGEAIGSPSAGFIGAGGYLTWTAPTAGVPAGTVVTLSALDGASANTGLGSLIRSGNFNISATADLIYAYQGPDRFTVDAFLGAVGNTTQDNLTNTGLIVGSTAILLVDAGNDDAPYVLADYGWDRGSENLFAAYLPLLGNPGNWNLYEPAQFTGFDTSSFTVAEDLTGPVITLLDPQDDSSDVPTGSTFLITFDENVVPGHGSIFIHPTGGGTSVEIPVAATLVNGSTVTIQPPVLLVPETHYRFEIPAGAYEDAVGNHFAGLPNPNSWDFTTAAADTTPPGTDYYILTPSNGTVGVSPKANLVLEFDEPIRKGSGNIAIFRTSDHTLLESIPAASPAVTVNDRFMTINPGADFAAGTTYHVLVDATVVEDLAANHFAGITEESGWTFTTTTLTTGSIAFTGFNADGAHSLAFVALTPVNAGETILFTDNGWNGGQPGAGGAFIPGEGQVVWTSPTGGLPAGTVVRLSQLNIGGITASTGSIRGSLNLDNFADSVYAYAGSDFNPVFLAFVSNHAGDSLDGTGLTAGTTAVRLEAGADIAAYSGPRANQTSFAAYLPLLGNAANWQHQDTATVPGSNPPVPYDDSTDGIAPDLPFNTTPFSLLVNDYGAWALTAFGAAAGGPNTGPAEDFDGDRLTNQEEYCFGLNPLSPASASPLRSGVSKTNGIFSYTRRKPSLTKLTCSIQTSTSLEANSWQDDSGAEQLVTGTDGDVETVQVTLSPARLGGPRLFARVKVN